MPERAPTKPTILIVEDEMLIRIMAEEYLHELGYGTVSTHSVEKAISLLEQRLDIRYAFIDVRLEGQAVGDKLAETVRRRWPPVRIILTSAFSVHDGILLPDEAQFMPKPYNLSVVAQTFERTTAGVR